jgi:DNA-binding NarL/FixJ family response regulator
MKEEKAIEVLIVDDHVLLRQGIRSMLEGYPDIHVVGEARNGLEAIFLVEKSPQASCSWISTCLE